MEYNVISADTHVDLGFLPWDLFTSQAPNRWKDQMPHVIQKDGRAQWWGRWEIRPGRSLISAYG